MAHARLYSSIDLGGVLKGELTSGVGSLSELANETGVSYAR
jgi:hypothetical protein